MLTCDWCGGYCADISEELARVHLALLDDPDNPILLQREKQARINARRQSAEESAERMRTRALRLIRIDPEYLEAERLAKMLPREDRPRPRGRYVEQPLVEGTQEWANHHNSWAAMIRAQQALASWSGLTPAERQAVISEATVEAAAIGAGIAKQGRPRGMAEAMARSNRLALLDEETRDRALFRHWLDLSKES